MAEPPSSNAKAAAPQRPTITLPPRPFGEMFFNGGSGVGFSPGPMTLVSNMFSDSDEYKSFSQLLAGAMASPLATPRPTSALPLLDEGKGGGGGGEDGISRFKQNKPAGLVVAQPPSMFTVPPGLSPATLLDSPGFGFFSPVGQGPFGMTHQQALAQVTAQAAQAQSQSNINLGMDYSSSLTTEAEPSLTNNTASNQLIPSSLPCTSSGVQESSDVSHSEQRLPSGDKPADDGYNWRKYGQKQVKGSEFPRSYYKCTHPSCPVKKKVERSLDGHVTEIIYKGQHNHEPPQNKRTKDSKIVDGKSNNQGVSELASSFQNDDIKKEQESSHIQESVTSDSEEAGNTVTGVEKDEDEPEPKRRAADLRVYEPVASQRAVTEPKIIVQTTSEVDLLDDGYRWRKYGQKVVKGNPYPRSYYKCTTPGCNVRKHVERAAADPKAVITTYEGKHNHDIPAAKSSIHNIGNANASQRGRAQNMSSENYAYYGNSQQPVARLRLKEEQIT